MTSQVQDMTNQNAEHPFNGPLFIVGLPRSGTKLLRSLLNGHSQIKITGCETGFLPYWAKHWENFGDLSQYNNFLKFYNKMQHFSYFIYARKDGWLIPVKTWYDMCESYDLTGVYEALMRHDSGIAFDENTIWGDKTPQYTNQLNLLHRLWPNAKFIHIIRDVRDYCLSMKHAWGKNMSRSAQRWVDDINIARNAVSNFPDQYLELKYEELLETPEKTLGIICDFLDIEFEKSMLQLTKPTERLGDAKHVTGVVQNNKKKYIEKMTPSMRYRIESIASPILKSAGYPIEYSGNPIRVSTKKMLFYKLLDGFNLVKSKIKRGGVSDALVFIKQYPSED